jgi:RNA polymerase sigma factor (sigma-70 family)
MTTRIAQLSTASVAEIAEGCRNGDAEAWDELLNRYERLVFTIACREGLGVEDAADVTQATFEALLAQLDRIRDSNQISFWLMTVARRIAWRIRNDRQRHYPADVMPGSDISEAVDSLGEVGTHLWLYDGVARLGSPCRELVTALYLTSEPVSYAELASRLGRPLGSIGPTRARCLGKLRDLLGEPE